MRKIFNKSFWIGFLSGILFTFAGLFIASWIDNWRLENIADNGVEFEDTLNLHDIHMGMTEEEFEKEMMKGVHGDWTQEQLDSFQLELALFNHGVPDSIIAIWKSLSDKQKLDAILGTAIKDIKLYVNE